MRIISQDGGIDLPYENVILESMCDCKCIFAHTGTGQPYRMAEYSTVEKMDKAMKMLRDCYTGSLYTDSHYDMAAQANVTDIVVNNVMFQFPEDDEVEI